MITVIAAIIKNDNKFLSAHLAEGPGSFIQTVMFYRENFNKLINEINENIVK